MKKILFYYPSNKRSVQIESTIKTLQKLGNEVVFLTTCDSGELHKQLKNSGTTCYTNNIEKNNAVFYYLSQVRFLVRFCREHKVELVFSNLQHSNFIAIFAQYFIRAKVIIFRHHFKFNKGHFGIPLKVNKNEVFFDILINTLAKLIVVPSSGVYNGMIKYESVRKAKVKIIPYLYDFSKYSLPEKEEIEKIKTDYPAKLRLIMVARLIPFKRHAIIFKLVKRLIDEGLSIKMLVLDEGPEEKYLNQLITKEKLEGSIIMLGFQKKLLAYMAASDLLIHPSLTEASNSVVKEMGLLKKPVAVCKGVGDFDDYIINGKNGFLMDIVKPENDAEEAIKTLYNNPEMIATFGDALNKTILENFSSNTQTEEKYKELVENF